MIMMMADRRQWSKIVLEAKVHNKPEWLRQRRREEEEEEEEEEVEEEDYYDNDDDDDDDGSCSNTGHSFRWPLYPPVMLQDILSNNILRNMK